MQDPWLVVDPAAVRTASAREADKVRCGDSCPTTPGRPQASHWRDGSPRPSAPALTAVDRRGRARPARRPGRRRSATSAARPRQPSRPDRRPPVRTRSSPPDLPSYVVPAPPPIAPRPQLPGGGYRIFGHHRFLVAYYGTAQTALHGRAGRQRPRHDAAPADACGPPVQAGGRAHPAGLRADRHRRRRDRPGPDHDYSHDIPRSLVQEYVKAAHRNGALLLLDIQTGRSPFPVVAKRWAWALEKPWVGLALDPEWRMGPHQVPGHVIGSVRAAEVNRTSLWLSRLVKRDGLPREAVRPAPVPALDAARHRQDRAPAGARDGAAHRRLRHPRREARDVPRGRPAPSVPAGLQALLPRDIHRFTPAAGTPDPARGSASSATSEPGCGVRDSEHEPRAG